MKSHKNLTRKNSNVFAQFDQKRLAELKEAFAYIDANNDGTIDEQDLKETWSTFGRVRWFWSVAHWMHLGVGISARELEAMFEDTPDSLNFTMFLALISSRLQEYGAEAASSVGALQAFELFDAKRTGKLSEEDLRGVLCQLMTEGEIEGVLKEAPRAEDGAIAYRAFAEALEAPL